MCRRMSHFNPNQHDFVMSEVGCIMFLAVSFTQSHVPSLLYCHLCIVGAVQVVFPRILYAKLLHEQFNSPWGHSHPLPPTSSPLHRPHVLGMKLVSCSLTTVM